MSIGGNGANRRPDPQNSNQSRLRTNDENDRTEPPNRADFQQITIEAASRVGRRRNRSLSQRLFVCVRNILSSPMTVGGLILGTIAGNYALSWLLGSDGASSNALSGGRGPSLGGPPPPPLLNHAQAGGVIPQTPAGSSQIPQLEDILRDAGHPQGEQQAQQRDYQNEGARPRTRHPQNSRERRAMLRAQRRAAEQAAQQPAQVEESLPPCPDEIAFILPDLPEQTALYEPSLLREMFNNGTVPNLCAGAPPEASLIIVDNTGARTRCRDIATGNVVTDCAENGHNHECPLGQILDDCPDVRLTDWSDSATLACINSKVFEKNIVIVLEGTDVPQNLGMPPTPEEQAAFNEEIAHFCTEDMNIYSESAPFADASAQTQSRIRFNATPRDILQGRARAANTAQQPAQRAEREAGAAQEEEQNQQQDQEQDEAQRPATSRSSSASNKHNESTKPRFTKK